MLASTNKNSYGAAEEGAVNQMIVNKEHLPLHGGKASSSKRAVIDFVQVFLDMLIPVSIFALTSWVLTFKFHYTSPFWAWLFVIVFPIACGVRAIASLLKEQSEAQQKWMKLHFGLCVLSWVTAMVVGEANFSSNTNPYYDMMGLNFAPGVDPSKSGQPHMDVGRFLFVHGSRLATDRAMGIRIGKVYCAAPIVNANVPESKWSNFDFWAVGEDCCSPTQPQSNFRCGAANNALATGGMRLMDDSARSFYRMAVQEAEATYMMKAKHPIFVTWVEDPAKELQSWYDAGWRMYLAWGLSVLVFMFFALLWAALLFARANLQSHPCKGIGFVKYVTANPDHDFLADVGYEEGMPKIITT